MEAVEKARITVIVDNHVDALLTERPDVERFTMLKHFVPPHGEPICTENGISYWIELHQDGRRHHVMFDTSLTSHVLLHNLRALGRSVDQLDRVVLSHGHPDHFGGLMGLLNARQHPLEVVVHPDAFLPKYIIDDNGNTVMTINARLDRGAIEAAHGVVVESRGPVEVARARWRPGRSSATPTAPSSRRSCARPDGRDLPRARRRARQRRRDHRRPGRRAARPRQGPRRDDGMRALRHREHDPPGAAHHRR